MDAVARQVAFAEAVVDWLYQVMALDPEAGLSDWDLLDALATLGLCLAEDPDEVAPMAYQAAVLGTGTER